VALETSVALISDLLCFSPKEIKNGNKSIGDKKKYQQDIKHAGIDKSIGVLVKELIYSSTLSLLVGAHMELFFERNHYILKRL
jgi:hypothetical protein